MNIIGLSAFYHDASCCLLQDGVLVAAASEERFSRIKHDDSLPVSAFRYCLSRGGISIQDVDYIAYYENPFTKANRQEWVIEQGNSGKVITPDPEMPEREIREKLGFGGEVLIFDHHSSHAASAFFYSGFEEAAIYTADGVGEWATTTFGYGQGLNINCIGEVLFPHSLGLLYSTITAYLGFRVNNGEYKVMGLAPYGKPKYLSKLWNLIQLKPKGQFTLDQRYFNFVTGTSMYAPALAELLGFPPRIPESELKKEHFDLAQSMQKLLEEVLLEQVRYLHESADSANLCMAGGVALNCVANSRMLRDGPFERLFVQPAAGDAGGCLGAAAQAHIQIEKKWDVGKPLEHVYFGPSYPDETITEIIEDTGIKYLNFKGKETELLSEVAARLEANQVVGWFQGAMEFGPRALGARSILANPMDPEIRDRLNKLVKKREAFRPFAPSVLEEHAAAHFDLDHLSPFMLETFKVRSPIALPGITHMDGSARPQTVGKEANKRFRKLLEVFYKVTGCPILINTSFNVRGEPIVCSPADALIGMIDAGLDALVVGDYLIDKSAIEPSLKAILYTLKKEPQDRHSDQNLYTFV